MSFKQGLHLDRETIRAHGKVMRAHDNVTIPKRIPGRSLCVPASDQGSTSECAAYATASKIERDRWASTGICEQIDPHPIYLQAKKVDGIDGEGTTLDAAFQAAIWLGLIPPDTKPIIITDIFTARRYLHRWGSVIVGLQIDEGWYSAQPDGWITQGTRKLGGHAVNYVEYANDYEAHDVVDNSWGGSQGWRGFNRFEHAYFEKMFVYGLTWEPA